MLKNCPPRVNEWRFVAVLRSHIFPQAVQCPDARGIASPLAHPDTGGLGASGTAAHPAVAGPTQPTETSAQGWGAVAQMAVLTLVLVVCTVWLTVYRSTYKLDLT